MATVDEPSGRVWQPTPFQLLQGSDPAVHVVVSRITRLALMANSAASEKEQDDSKGGVRKCTIFCIAVSYRTSVKLGKDEQLSCHACVDQF